MTTETKGTWKISIQVKSIIIAILFAGLGWQGSYKYYELKNGKQELQDLGFAGKPIPSPYALAEGIDKYHAEMEKRRGR